MIVQYFVNWAPGFSSVLPYFDTFAVLLFDLNCTGATEVIVLCFCIAQNDEYVYFEHLKIMDGWMEIVLDTGIGQFLRGLNHLYPKNILAIPPPQKNCLSKLTK